MESSWILYLSALQSGGQDRIRTCEGVSQRIYSLMFYSVVDGGGGVPVDTFCLVKRAKVADLPCGIGITRNSNGITDYWRVRLGKKFTGGNVVTRNFEALADARRWIFGDAQKVKTVPMPATGLRNEQPDPQLSSYRQRKSQKRRLQYQMSIGGITLHAAVDYAIKRMNLAEDRRRFERWQIW